MAVSGMANSVFSVATRKRPWTDRPTPCRWRRWRVREIDHCHDAERRGKERAQNRASREHSSLSPPQSLGWEMLTGKKKWARPTLCVCVCACCNSSYHERWCVRREKGTFTKVYLGLHNSANTRLISYMTSSLTLLTVSWVENHLVTSWQHLCC